MPSVTEELKFSPSPTNWSSFCTSQQDKSEQTAGLAYLRAVETAELGKHTQLADSFDILLWSEATSATLAVWVESEDEAIIHRAAARLEDLRKASAQLAAADNGSPYEWTDEGLADMRETLYAGARSQSRLIQQEQK